MVPEGYKPSARAVLRFRGHILKAYGKERSYEAAVTGLRAAAETPLRTPGMEACFPTLRLTVQPDVAGSSPPPIASAAAAGLLVRRLQASSIRPVRVRSPDALLALASQKAALAERLAPELGHRVDNLLALLRSSAPSGGKVVPAHGDFDVDQLLLVGGELVVIDFDDVCRAPAGLDLATYLADVVRGRPGDREAIERVRGPLLAGYGGCPPALDWYVAAVVLARAPHPFNRFVADWPERVEGMVRTAEEMLA
jgi:hypothetical protein